MVKKKNNEQEGKLQNEILDKEEITKDKEMEKIEPAKDSGEGDKLIDTESKKPAKTKSKSKTEKIQEELEELKDKYLRLSAEFDNYRKRTLKEKMELTKYASEETLKDLLPVIDDFERALNNINEAVDMNAIKDGMKLIGNKFKNFLSQKGLKEIDALHQEFNMDLHEAITKIPAPEEKLKGKIVDVIEKGYFLNDKVIRFSKVVIGE